MAQRDAGRKAHARAVARLQDAVAAVSDAERATGLQKLADALPPAVDVEAVALHLRDADEARRLHLVAAAGFPPRDVRALAAEPLTIARARAMLVLGSGHTFLRSLGFQWVHGAWLRHGADIVGLVVVATRTARRPEAEALALLGEACDRVAAVVEASPRRSVQLRWTSNALARSAVVGDRATAVTRASELRPSEQAVLDLVADGLSTAQVAEVLVISPHTVRTHVKNALRRLGVHSRAEAAEAVRRERGRALL